MEKHIKVAMLGFGGIARSHRKAYWRLAQEGNTGIELVAICDIDPAQFTNSVAINLGADQTAKEEEIHTYTDLDEMLAKEEFEMIDICLPTYLHKEYTVRMLRAGKHVLCEKPMSLSYEDCDEMIRVAKEEGRKLMIGQCLRFDLSYLYLKECIDDGRFGALKSVFMDRLSAHPTWGFENWFSDSSKSGGCLLDLHVHDIDMVRFFLGEPRAVSAISYDGISRWEMVNTRLFYDGVMVVVNGSWDESPTRGFESGCRLTFEKAQVVLNGRKVTVYPNEGEVYEVEIPKCDYYAEEIRMIANTIMDPSIKNEANPPESARNTVALMNKLRDSADLGGQVLAFEASK